MRWIQSVQWDFLKQYIVMRGELSFFYKSIKQKLLEWLRGLIVPSPFGLPKTTDILKGYDWWEIHGEIVVFKKCSHNQHTLTVRVKLVNMVVIGYRQTHIKHMESKSINTLKQAYFWFLFTFHAQLPALVLI